MNRGNRNTTARKADIQYIRNKKAVQIKKKKTYCIVQRRFLCGSRNFADCRLLFLFQLHFLFPHMAIKQRNLFLLHIIKYRDSARRYTMGILQKKI